MYRTPGIVMKESLFWWEIPTICLQLCEPNPNLAFFLKYKEFIFIPF